MWKLLHPAASLALLIAVQASLAMRQEPPTPQPSWNSKVIEAVFDGVLIDEQNHLRIYYVLKNSAETPYSIARQSDVDVMLKVRRSARSSLVPSGQRIKIDCPILIQPRGQRITVFTDVSRTYDFKKHLPMHPTPEQEREYNANLSAFMRTQWPGLQGFVIFDKRQRYRIDLRAPW